MMKRQKAEGRRQNETARHAAGIDFRLLPFAFCLLP
jgi:hypothetical protein